MLYVNHVMDDLLTEIALEERSWGTAHVPSTNIRERLVAGILLHAKGQRMT